jgi:hypothetical protein
MILEPGTLVWMNPREYELSLKHVGTVVASLEDMKENMFYVACGGVWFLRSDDKLKLLTVAGKVLYMFESGQQCE